MWRADLFARRLRVSHTCKASPSGTGFTFTLRVRNAHDDRESIPWLSRVEARVGSETTFATLDRQPFTLKRTIRDDGDVETKVEVELTFYFQRARDAASPPASSIRRLVRERRDVDSIFL